MAKADVVADHLRGLSYIDKNGSEIPDSRPAELPVGFVHPESIQDTIRRLITDPRIREELDGEQMESFDEADDFDIEDDVPQSPHEENFDPLHLLAREHEVSGGAVRPRTPEEIAAAAKIVTDHKAALAAAEAAKAKAVPPSTHT